jgi:hypothetical protein
MVYAMTTASDDKSKKGRGNYAGMMSRGGHKVKRRA